MKKFRTLALVMALLAITVVVSLPQVAFGAATAYITITATGSELNITCNQTAWNVGTVGASDNVHAGTDNWGVITNATSESVDITIHGHDMKSTDNLTTWDLSDNGTGSIAPALGMFVTDRDGHYNIVIREAAVFNTWFTELGAGGTHDFGLEFNAPSQNQGNKTMEMVGETNSNVETPRGICFTASVHV